MSHMGRQSNGTEYRTVKETQNRWELELQWRRHFESVGKIWFWLVGYWDKWGKNCSLNSCITLKQVPTVSTFYIIFFKNETLKIEEENSGGCLYIQSRKGFLNMKNLRWLKREDWWICVHTNEDFVCGETAYITQTCKWQTGNYIKDKGYHS